MDSLMTNVHVGCPVKIFKENQKYMLGFAWVIPNELQLYEVFPGVSMVDTVEKNNKEWRPLLTVGRKDSNGKMFIFLDVSCLINKVGYFGGYLVLSCLHWFEKKYLRKFAL